MTVTVSTSIDGVTPPAVVPDLQTAIQAAQAFAAQAAASYQEANVILQECQDVLSGATGAADQAAAILTILLNNQGLLSATVITNFFKNLPTSPPFNSAGTGVPWNDNGVIRLT